MHDDFDLVARLKARDEAAFDAVYDRFNARLFTFLVRLSRDRDRAHDLLEETWLRLVTHADRLRPDTNLGSWLFTVARNLYLSECRARVLEQSDEVILAHPSPAPSPFEETAANESHRQLEAALASLPLLYREVLLLVAIDGLSTAATATVCGISNDAVRQRLSRGRAMLAERMAAATVPHLKAREVTP
ncbi:MAG: RNA polymerase sigma factor [Vicinamibacterales bacterium]